MNRLCAAFLLICFCICSTSFAYTIVLKSGKKMEGTLLLDETQSIRFMDSAGVRMVLKKSIIDMQASKRIHAEQEAAKKQTIEVTKIPEPAVAPARVRSFTNRDVGASPSRNRLKPLDASLPLEQQLSRAKRDYDRLSGMCRNAGGARPNKQYIRTDTYIVNGKKVSVTGNWADPAEVSRAKQICDDAQLAHERWIQIREQMQTASQDRSTAGR